MLDIHILVGVSDLELIPLELRADLRELTCQCGCGCVEKIFISQSSEHLIASGATPLCVQCATSWQMAAVMLGQEVEERWADDGSRLDFDERLN